MPSGRSKAHKSKSGVVVLEVVVCVPCDLYSNPSEHVIFGVFVGAWGKIFFAGGSPTFK